MTDIELNCRVTAIDEGTRTITVKDVQGASHPFKWTEPLDVVMRKWKAGYYLTLKYDPDTYSLKNAVYWNEGKDTFPKQQGSGKQYVPKNEKPCVFESVLKSCCDQAEPTDFMGGESYEKKMDRIWQVAKKISLEIVQLSGA